MGVKFIGISTLRYAIRIAIVMINKEKQHVISNLLEKIERGDIQAEIITTRLFEMVVEMNNKIETLSQRIIHLSNSSRKISVKLF